MTLTELLTRMTSKEISEWMAYDRTNSQTWIDEHNAELSKEATLDPIEQAKAFKLLLRGADK